jgi:uncharacterized protein YoxC
MSQPNTVENTALSITRWVGSPASVVLHTLLFIGSFALAFSGLIEFDRMLLVLTTIVSLEAIYLAIFIQMTLNYQRQTIEAVEKDIDEMQEDVEEIQEDIDEMQEDVEEMQEDVEELQEDVEDISEEVEDISEEDAADEARETAHVQTLADIQKNLLKLTEDIAKLQNK